MFVKPGTGPSPDDPKEKIALKVRDPATRRHIPADGADVPNTPFWRRLLRDGDVVEATPPTAEAAKEPAAQHAEGGSTQEAAPEPHAASAEAAGV